MDTMTNPSMAFVERFAVAAEAQRLPRIAGRIMAYLMIQERAVTADHLAEELKASRASISTNTRLLEGMGVIERTGVPGDRRDWYQFRPDPLRNLLDGEIASLKRMRGVVEEGLAVVPGSDSLGGDRLRRMARFYDSAIRSVEEMLQHWRSEEK